MTIIVFCRRKSKKCDRTQTQKFDKIGNRGVSKRVYTNFRPPALIGAGRFCLTSSGFNRRAIEGMTLDR
ncbi:hypothetical protein [Microcoleus sp. LEGE 07076]|uniref:hypothetical protein n=1 Tax=Microcoleus sp. LEGE 07076 TaxID=915322 RepID=UPI001882F59A|nr:hypothetical protein [Microcoleus sp. LEGE 07076]